MSKQTYAKKHVPMIVFALLFPALLCPGTAWSQEKIKLVILPVDSDELSAVEKGRLSKATARGVKKYEQYLLLPTPKVDLLDEVVNFECIELDAQCLGKIGAKYGAEQVLYIAWTKGALSLKLVDTKAGKQIAFVTAKVGRKELDKFMSQAGLVKLLGPVPKKPKIVVVEIKANVEKAEVFVNQRKVGYTPAKVRLKPGKYTISLRRPGFLMVEKKIVVKGPGPQKVAMELKPIPKKPVTPVTGLKIAKPVAKKKVEEKRPFYKTWWFWIGTGVAVAAVTATTVLLVTSQQESENVGTVKFLLSPNSAEDDAIFYR